MDILSFILGYQKGKSQGGDLGNLKRGIYFEFLTNLPKASAYHRFFEYDGGLYLYVVTSTSTKTADIYKYENNEFTLVTTFTNTAICGTWEMSNGVEWNGKCYFEQLGKLLVWDGTNMTVANDSLPFDDDGEHYMTLAVYNDELYGFSTGTNGVSMYKINADYSTTLVNTYTITNVKSQSNTGAWFNVNNDVFMIAYVTTLEDTRNKYWLCKFNGNEFEPYVRFDESITSTSYAVVDDKLYMGYKSGSGYGYIYEADLTNKTSSKISNSWYYRYLFSYKNELYLDDNTKYYTFAKGHIVSGE